MVKFHPKWEDGEGTRTKPITCKIPKCSFEETIYYVFLFHRIPPIVTLCPKEVAAKFLLEIFSKSHSYKT